MKPIRKVTVNCHSAEDVTRELLKASRGNDYTWAYDHEPFSTTIHLLAFKCASAVPDDFIDLMWRTGSKLAKNGTLIPFTKAAIIRDQNRGLGCE